MPVLTRSCPRENQNGRTKRCRQQQAEHDAGQRRGLQRRRHFRPFGKIRQIPVAFLVPDGIRQHFPCFGSFGVHVFWLRTAVQVRIRFGSHTRSLIMSRSKAKLRRGARQNQVLL